MCALSLVSRNHSTIQAGASPPDLQTCTKAAYRIYEAKLMDERKVSRAKRPASRHGRTATGMLRPPCYSPAADRRRHLLYKEQPGIHICNCESIKTGLP